MCWAWNPFSHPLAKTKKNLWSTLLYQVHRVARVCFLHVFKLWEQAGIMVQSKHKPPCADSALPKCLSISLATDRARRWLLGKGSYSLLMLVLSGFCGVANTGLLYGHLHCCLISRALAQPVLLKTCPPHQPDFEQQRAAPSSRGGRTVCEVLLMEAVQVRGNSKSSAWLLLESAPEKTEMFPGLSALDKPATSNFDGGCWAEPTACPWTFP